MSGKLILLEILNVVGRCSFKFLMRNKFTVLLPFLTVFVSCTVFSQDLRPGLQGMAPIKWITIKTTQAPGRVYRSINSQSKTYTHEDIYFRAWIPVVAKSKFGLAIGPHYRTEQLELKRPGEDPMKQLSNWRLRSMGIDIKSFIKLDSTSWLINTAQISQSGNLNYHSGNSIPLCYTFSALYLKKKSINKELGFGLMVNKSSSFMVLPVFVFNYNYSSRSGIEISLPHKISWRHNLTPSDILYIKSEAVTRTYFVNGVNGTDRGLFRRIDVDMGIAYNKQFGRLIGAELFAGYRQNVSYELPQDLVSVKNSGWAASFEIYIRPPQGFHLGKKK